MNTMIIGVGYHARRIYLPYLMENECLGSLVCGVDLRSQKKVIESYLSDRGYILPMYYTNDQSQNALSHDLDSLLKNLVEKYMVDSVIISTEPLMHHKYAKWALENNLNILMDKPVTSEEGVSVDLIKSRKIVRDFDELTSIYIDKKRAGLVNAFSLMSQRRFHPAYNLMKSKLREVYERTNCPVTSIQISHSDGMWRTPTEIVEMDYHPYNQGYGKISHSGYHSLDMLNWLQDFTERSEKACDSIEVFSNLVRPVDFLSQINLNDYRGIFPEFDNHNKYSEEEFCQLCQDYGELDAFCSIAFKRAGKTICLGSLNAIHNGFSQRGWLDSGGRDLYKGNGRIRQESYFIEQGPFQSISFISYQSKEINSNENQNPYEFGGERHLDIHIFRNSSVFPDWKTHEVFSVKDIAKEFMTGYSRGHQEDARIACIDDFYESISKGRDTKSDLLDHRKGTYTLSAIYESEIQKRNGENPLVNASFEIEEDCSEVVTTIEANDIGLPVLATV